MKTITTNPLNDHYRQIPSQNFYGFPDEFNVNDWQVSSYVQGDNLNRKTPVTLDCFDSFRFHSYSINDKGSEKFMHVIGNRINENTATFLILKRR